MTSSPTPADRSPRARTTSTRVGRFLRLADEPSLIGHITRRLLSGQPLGALRPDELRAVRLACLLTLGRGVELLLLRETVANTGVSDNALLNRKVDPAFWTALYHEARRHLPPAVLRRSLGERPAAGLARRLTRSPALPELVARLLRRATGDALALRLPPELLRDGNMLFSLGTVYGHRLFRLLRFFARYWGDEAHEPALRVICQKLWFFYLLAWRRLRVSPEAFRVQRSEHELGILTFLVQDYLTFTGTPWRRAPPLPRECRADVTRLLTGRAPTRR